MSMAYDMVDFRVDVVEASKKVPVVIDFWAEWCGPCRVLGPVLEKLATDAKGKWKLVKINTEQHPQIAAQFGIRSIPAVKMVHQGAITAEFVGALPEAQIKKWLEQHLPVNEEEKAAESQQELLLQQGDREGWRQLLAEQFRSDSSSAALAAQLAVMSLPDRIEDARALLGVFKEDQKYEIEKDTVLYFEYVRTLDTATIFEGKPEAVSAYLRGHEALRHGHFEQALSAYIESMQLDRSVDEDGARRACIAVFCALGEGHPLSKAWRRRFSMSLY